MLLCGSSTCTGVQKNYIKVSILTPEDVLYNDFVTLSAFKAWVEKDNDLKMKKEKGEEVFLQVYSLGNKSKFVPARAGNFNTSVCVVCTSREFFNAALKLTKKSSPAFLFCSILIFYNLTKKLVGGILRKEEVPEHRVISTRFGK